MVAALSSLKVLAGFVAVVAGSGLDILPRQEAQIPSFVLDYAPLVYIDVNDYYLPSDIGAQVTHTHPAVNHTRVKPAPSNLSLSNLSSLNEAGNCTSGRFGKCFLYLAAHKEASYPRFFNGTLPNPETGETEGAKSCAVIVYDHGNGTVDAFYMYFYAFNLGYNIYGYQLGNHVGDWEHTMLRFVNSQPSTMWFSQHDGGEVFTYDALSKKNGRPLVYSARGTHANYAVPGRHGRPVSVITVNDTTSAGPLWDPILSAYFYTFTPTSPESTSNNQGTFSAANLPNNSISSGTDPTDWLLFSGKWGNKQLRDSNPNQTNLAGQAYTWEDGPTGPYDKDLNRLGTCPDGNQPCVTQSTLPAISGNPTPSQTISRSSSTTTKHTKSTTRTKSTTSTQSMSSSSTSDPPTSTGAGGNQGNSNRLGNRNVWSMSLGAYLLGAAIQL